MIWEERRPKYSETVKINFAEFTNLGTKIGVCLDDNSSNGLKIQFGDCIRYFDSTTTFFCLK